MMNPKTIIATTVVFVSICFIAGCGGDEDVVDKKPVARKQPTAPKAPPKKSLADIQNEVNADLRIAWNDENNSESNIEREAIFRFFTAFLQNDQATLHAMLSPVDQLELGTLTETTDLVALFKNVTRVDIQTGSDPSTGKSCVIAAYEVGMNYQPQLWSFQELNGSIVFSALESPPGLIDQLSGNWIKTYFKKREELYASALDDDHTSSYQLAGEGTTSSGVGKGTPNTPNRPNTPGKPGSPNRPDNPTGPLTPK